LIGLGQIGDQGKWIIILELITFGLELFFVGLGIEAFKGNFYFIPKKAGGKWPNGTKSRINFFMENMLKISLKTTLSH
jgi:hypothetical protein